MYPNIFFLNRRFSPFSRTNYAPPNSVFELFSSVWLVSAVLPGRLYKAHAPWINYYSPEKTQRLLLWLCTLPFPLSTPWLLFRMIHILFLFPPYPNLSRVCIVNSSGRSRQFFSTVIYCGRVGWIAVNRPQMKRLASLREHTQCHHLVQKPPFSPVHTQVRSKRFHKSPDFETVRFWFPKTLCGRNTLGRLWNSEKKKPSVLKNIFLDTDGREHNIP